MCTPLEIEVTLLIVSTPLKIIVTTFWEDQEISQNYGDNAENPFKRSGNKSGI